jgi:hypothetical protein
MVISCPDERELFIQAMPILNFEPFDVTVETELRPDLRSVVMTHAWHDGPCPPWCEAGP